MNNILSLSKVIDLKKYEHSYNNNISLEGIEHFTFRMKTLSPLNIFIAKSKLNNRFSLDLFLLKASLISDFFRHGKNPKNIKLWFSSRRCETTTLQPMSILELENYFIKWSCDEEKSLNHFINEQFKKNAIEVNKIDFSKVKEVAYFHPKYELPNGYGYYGDFLFIMDNEIFYVDFSHVY